jgi:GTP-binding protein SAR1
MFGWLRSVFDFFGLFPRNAKIAFLGLDNAGKTTLLQMLKENRVGTNPPTVHPNHDELLIQNIRFSTFDLGGHETARILWRNYTKTVSGIVFLVDAADRTRFQEAKEELSHLRDQLDGDGLADVPIAVLGNKIDIPTAASEDELRASLGIFRHFSSGKASKKSVDEGVREVEVFMCSVVKRMGYNEAFQWLSDRVKGTMGN